ncbi:hypothetical protein N9078_01360, partial [bacterium]|nr:hypothetical protein [bacterium]
RAGRKGRHINLISLLVANPWWLPSTWRPSHSKKNRPSCSIKSRLSWVQELVCATIFRGFMDESASTPGFLVGWERNDQLKK